MCLYYSYSFKFVSSLMEFYELESIFLFCVFKFLMYNICRDIFFVCSLLIHIYIVSAVCYGYMLQLSTEVFCYNHMFYRNFQPVLVSHIEPIPINLYIVGFGRNSSFQGLLFFGSIRALCWYIGLNYQSLRRLSRLYLLVSVRIFWLLAGNT